MKLRPNMVLYKYLLKRRIGKGSFGEVWLAVDKAIDREFAVKVLNPGTSINDRLKEAQVGHTFAHDNLVTVHQADVVSLDGHNNVVLIAMDYLSRGPVSNLVNEGEFLPLPCALKIVIQILKSLQYLHSKELLHNDIKPDNILMGDDGQAKLTDYGILVPMYDREGAMSPPYFYNLHAAPEASDGSGINEQTDVFQVGLTLFRLLVGLGALKDKHDELGTTEYVNAVLNNQLITTSDLPEYIPKRLCRVVRKAVHPDLSQRYSSALDMRRELEKVKYRGYWTVTSDGFRGFDDRCSYRYVKERRHDGVHVTAYRRYQESGRETKVSKYGLAKATESRAQEAIRSFVRGVVEGL